MSDDKPLISEADNTIIELGPPGLPDKIKDAFKLYTALVDVNSITQFPLEGWGIYGSKEFSRNCQGIVIGIFGQQKVGKTWLTAKLVGIDLPHSFTINTTGVGVYIPPAVQKESAYRTAPVPARQGGTAGTTGAGRGSRGSLIAKAGTRIPPPEAYEVQRELVFLDFAGSDAPCAVSSIPDRRCTENLVRDILINISEKYLYVTNKFLRTCQIELDGLVRDLDANITFNDKKIGFDNKIFVVHNLYECTTKELLDVRVKELKEVYGSALQQTELDCDVAVCPGKCYFYETEKLRHFFLVRDPEEALTLIKPADLWRKQHNMRVLHAILINFRLGMQKVSPFSLLPKLREVALKYLSSYTDDFDPANIALPLKILDGFPVPGFFPKWNGEVPSELLAGDEPKYTEDGFSNFPFKLKDIEFVDNRAVSTAIFTGGWESVPNSAKKTKLTGHSTRICVRVEMPGVTIDAIKVKRIRKGQQSVVIVRAERSPLIPGGPQFQAAYTANLGARDPFSMEQDENTFKKAKRLKNGIYTIFLDRQQSDSK